MRLIAKEHTGQSFEPIAPGVYVGICYGLIDLGTHPNPTFGREAHKILLQWEIPEMRADCERDGKIVNLPRAISKRYTLSLSEKANLRRDLESWRGRKFTAQELAGFDLKALLGASCQLQIVHESSTEGRNYATIAAIMALPKGTPRRAPENPLLFFTFEDVAPGKVLTLPSGLPKWVADTVTSSKEWQAILGRAPTPASSSAAAPGSAGETNNEDDVPF